MLTHHAALPCSIRLSKRAGAHVQHALVQHALHSAADEAEAFSDRALRPYDAQRERAGGRRPQQLARAALAGGGAVEPDARDSNEHITHLEGTLCCRRARLDARKAQLARLAVPIQVEAEDRRVVRLVERHLERTGQRTRREQHGILSHRNHLRCGGRRRHRHTVDGNQSIAGREVGLVRRQAGSHGSDDHVTSDLLKLEADACLSWPLADFHCALVATRLLCRGGARGRCGGHVERRLSKLVLLRLFDFVRAFKRQLCISLVLAHTLCVLLVLERLVV
mmetsp:Transcript_30376/g.83244  ORF Transcript_30376/g.83244 Transcript_30376/m.83244 type:complete len:279 (+) Transcript_30376:193-1029(+)